MTVWRDLKQFFAPKLRSVAHFFLAQGLTMAGNLVYGFLCLRMLEVSAYAKYTILFGFMGSLTVLLDVGISNTLAPLIGQKLDDRVLIADYIATLRQIARRLYLIVVPIATLAFLELTKKQRWGWPFTCEMLIALGIAAWFARVTASYGAVLILLRDRAHYYRVQVIGSLGSLCLLVLCYFAHVLTIHTAIALNLGQIIYYAISYYRRSEQLLNHRGSASKAMQTAVIRLTTPNLPGTLFYAFQGQVSILLITAFGKGAASIASIGALGRLGQLFLLFAQMNPIFVEPFFAKLSFSRLKRMYVMVALGVLGFSFLVTVIGFAFPQPFLWILGAKYQTLKLEIGLAIAGSAIRFAGGVVYTMNSSRRFVFWGNSVSIIIGTIVVESIYIWRGDLSTVRGILILNILTASVEFTSSVSAGIYGFWRGPQSVS